jgi:hypothetical protein
VLNQAPRHEDVSGNPGIAPLFLTSALDGDEWSASDLGRFTPGETDSCTLDRGLGRPQNCSRRCREEKNPAPLQGIDPAPGRKARRKHRKHFFLYFCVLIHCCRDVFTAPLRSNERGADHGKHSSSTVARVRFRGNVFT